MRPPRRVSARPLAACVALFSAACGDAVGPPLVDDPVVLVGRLRSLDSVFATPTLQINASLGARFHPPYDATNVFPDSLLGHTFEWDAARDAYRMTKRSGAPAGGVRQMLYVLAPGGAPNLPLAEAGRTDFYPTPGISPALRAIVRDAGGVVVQDLRVDGVFGTSAFVLNGVGTLTRGEARALLEADYAADPSLVRTTFKVDVPARALQVRADVSTQYLATGERQDVELVLWTRGETMTMSGWVERRVNGTVTTWIADLYFQMNGNGIASITGTDAQIKFRDASGAVVTGAWAMALNSFFRLPGTLQGQFGNVLQPAVNVLRGL